MYFPNVAEDLGKLGNDFTKRDHTIIVGGPGNSLDVPLLSSKGYQLHFRKVKWHKYWIFKLLEAWQALDKQGGEDCESKAWSGSVGV